MRKKNHYHNIVVVDLDYSSSLIKRILRNFLKHTSFKHCPNCGALTPELKFDIGDKTLSFCCYSINEYEIDKKLSTPDMICRSDTKKIIETNYAKFGKYLTRKEPQP